MQTEDGDATAIRGFGDDRLIVNMSVWTSVEALAQFVYTGLHREILGRRREWFVPMRETFQVPWWVPRGQRPTLVESEERLDLVRLHGPTARAFTFRHPFPAPQDPPVRTDDGWFCPPDQVCSSMYSSAPVSE